MHTTTRTPFQSHRAYLLAVIMGMAAFGVSAAEMKVKLSGDQEVPPVTTTASGTAQFTLKDDMVSDRQRQNARHQSNCGPHSRGRRRQERTGRRCADDEG